jgi:hypothetical protein
VNAREGSLAGAGSLAVTLGKRAIKLGLLVPASIARSREPGLLILGYHRVGSGMGREMDVSLDVFRSQMRFLAGHREVVALEEGVRRMAAPLERDLVAITFDDGYRDVYTRAWPVLRDLAIPRRSSWRRGSWTARSRRRSVPARRSEENLRNRCRGTKSRRCTPRGW